MVVLYNLGLWLYMAAVRLASLRSRKARLWLSGRQGIRSQLEKLPSGPLIWFHCASLGEFEQGRPLIESLKQMHPEFRILVTFFSPSGFEIRKNYDKADLVTYLPFDTLRNAKEFIGKIRPVMVFFVKYEFWYNMLTELYRNKVPVYLVSAVFRPDQIFFRPWGGIFMRLLSGYQKIFVQDSVSGDLLREKGLSNFQVTGDTRFDRVAEISQRRADLGPAADFAEQYPVLVAGSTWPEDEEMLAAAYLKVLKPAGWRLIIAPHEISEDHNSSLKNLFGNEAVLFSGSRVKPGKSHHGVMIIDNIGMLSALYRLGRIAYVGGGFGKGIHNVLEAAVYGMPVLFGPEFRKFTEAKDLVRQGGGFPVTSGAELCGCLTRLTEYPSALATAGEIAGRFVRSRTGATVTILKEVDRSLEELKAF